jgi:polysaccharide biosynthesis/export protein
MLKTDKNYPFDVPPENAPSNYKIAPNDIIEFRLYANNGFIVVDNGSNNDVVRNSRIEINYNVLPDGSVRLPLLDTVRIVDQTIREIEFKLEQRYSEYYVNPFIQIQVVNKRVVVFPGSGSDARVITLTNNNTTLMEALALAGGIPDRGRASRVKLMRKSGKERKVYLIDLSTIDGLKYTDLIVQANDYIYVEPAPRLGREILTEIAPYISLLSSAIVVYSVFQKF